MADLSFAVFGDCDLSGANLRLTDLTSTDFSQNNILTNVHVQVGILDRCIEHAHAPRQTHAPGAYTHYILPTRACAGCERCGCLLPPGHI